MKIEQFIIEFDKQDKNNIDGYIIKHIKNNYIPYEQKADIAKSIVDTCYWKTETDIDGIEEKRLYVDSVAKYMCTCMAIIKLYTDIECQRGDGKMLEDFNTLNSRGIIDLLIENIDQRELKEFNLVLQMTCDDVITNEFENHAFISKQIERFGKLIDTALSPVISQLDLGQIQEVINQFK